MSIPTTFLGARGAFAPASNVSTIFGTFGAVGKPGGICCLQVLPCQWTTYYGVNGTYDPDNIKSIVLPDAAGGSLTLTKTTGDPLIGMSGDFGVGGSSGTWVFPAPFGYSGAIQINYIDDNGTAQTFSGTVDFGTSGHVLVVIHFDAVNAGTYGHTTKITQHLVDYDSRPPCSFEAVNVGSQPIGTYTPPGGGAPSVSSVQFSGQAAITLTIVPDDTSGILADVANAYTPARNQPPSSATPPSATGLVGLTNFVSTSTGNVWGISGPLGYGPSDSTLYFLADDGNATNLNIPPFLLNMWPWFTPAPTAVVAECSRVNGWEYWRPWFSAN